MIQMKKCRTALSFIVLFALLCSGCGTSGEEPTDVVALAYTGSKSFEYYDVGNDRNADFLSGRGTEVCITSSEYNEEGVSGQDYVYGLYRVSDHTILEQSGITDKIYPASTTKLLTALLALKYCNLSENVTFSYNASHLGVYGAVSCDFKEGDTVVLDSIVPLAKFMDFPTRLASFSSGKAVCQTNFHGYRECKPGEGCDAPRRGVDPLDRAKWILWARGAMTDKK